MGCFSGYEVLGEVFGKFCVVNFCLVFLESICFVFLFFVMLFMIINKDIFFIYRGWNFVFWDEREGDR